MQSIIRPFLRRPAHRFLKTIIAVVVLSQYCLTTLEVMAQRQESPKSGTTTAVPSVTSLVNDGYKLTWSDEFEGTELNPANWMLQKIRRVNSTGSEEAVQLSDGKLKLSVFTDKGENKSGFLATDGKVQFKYGFVEARLKLRPTGKAFMGFWMQSPTIGNPIGSPETAGVEIDICEYLLTDMKGVDRSNTYRCALHWDGYGKDHKSQFEYVRPADASLPLSGEWHTFGLLWTEEGYRFFCDGKETWRADSPISKQVESLRLSCEVYSPTFLSSKKDFEFGSLSDTTTSLECDWVRVWQRDGQELRITEKVSTRK